MATLSEIERVTNMTEEERKQYKQWNIEVLEQYNISKIDNYFDIFNHHDLIKQIDKKAITIKGHNICSSGLFAEEGSKTYEFFYSKEQHITAQNDNAARSIEKAIITNVADIYSAMAVLVEYMLLGEGWMIKIHRPCKY